MMNRETKFNIVVDFDGKQAQSGMKTLDRDIKQLIKSSAGISSELNKQNKNIRTSLNSRLNIFKSSNKSVVNDTSKMVTSIGKEYKRLESLNKNLLKSYKSRNTEVKKLNKQFIDNNSDLVKKTKYNANQMIKTNDRLAKSNNARNSKMINSDKRLLKSNSAINKKMIADEKAFIESSKRVHNNEVNNINRRISKYKELQKLTGKVNSSPQGEGDISGGGTIGENVGGRPKAPKITDFATQGGIASSIASLLPMIGVLKSVTSVGLEFDKTMSSVRSKLNITNEEFKELNETALRLGADTTKSATEVAVAMDDLAAKGYNAKQIAESMEGIIAASEASGEDLAQTSDLISTTLNVFKLKASESTHVADVLSQTSIQSAADISGLAYAFKYASPSAASLNIGVEELSASVGILADNGIRGETAGTTLRASFDKLLNPSKEAGALMRQLGIETVDSQGNFLGLTKVLENFSNGMKGMTATQKKQALATILGTESSNGFLVLMNEGTDKLKRYTAELKNADGASKKLAAIKLNNLSGDLMLLGGALESLRYKIFNEHMNTNLRKLVQGVTYAVEKFTELPSKFHGMILISGIAISSILPIITVLGILVASTMKVAEGYRLMTDRIRMNTRFAKENAMMNMVMANSLGGGQQSKDGNKKGNNKNNNSNNIKNNAITSRNGLASIIVTVITSVLNGSFIKAVGTLLGGKKGASPLAKISQGSSGFLGKMISTVLGITVQLSIIKSAVGLKNKILGTGGLLKKIFTGFIGGAIKGVTNLSLGLIVRPALGMITGIGTGLVALLGPVGATIVGIGALTGAVLYGYMKVKAVRGAVLYLVDALRMVPSMAQGVYSGIKGMIVGVFNMLSQLPLVGKIFGGIASTVMKLGSGMASYFGLVKQNLEQRADIEEKKDFKDKFFLEKIREKLYNSKNQEIKTDTKEKQNKINQEINRINNAQPKGKGESYIGANQDEAKERAKEQEKLEKAQQKQFKEQERIRKAQEREQERQRKAVEKQRIKEAKEQEKQRKAIEKQRIKEAKEQEKQRKAQAKAQERQRKEEEKQRVRELKDKQKREKAEEKARLKALKNKEKAELKALKEKEKREREIEKLKEKRDKEIQKAKEKRDKDIAKIKEKREKEIEKAMKEKNENASYKSMFDKEILMTKTLEDIGFSKEVKKAMESIYGVDIVQYANANTTDEKTSYELKNLIKYLESDEGKNEIKTVNKGDNKNLNVVDKLMSMLLEISTNSNIKSASDAGLDLIKPLKNKMNREQVFDLAKKDKTNESLQELVGYLKTNKIKDNKESTVLKLMGDIMNKTISGNNLKDEFYDTKTSFKEIKEEEKRKKEEQKSISDVDNKYMDISKEIMKDSVYTGTSDGINNTGLGDISSDLGSINSDLTGSLGDLGSGLNSDLVGLGSDITGGLDGLDASLSGDLNSLTGDLSSELDGLGSDLTSGIGDLGADFNSGFGDLGANFNSGFGDLGTDFMSGTDNLGADFMEGLDSGLSGLPGVDDIKGIDTGVNNIDKTLKGTEKKLYNMLKEAGQIKGEKTHEEKNREGLAKLIAMSMSNMFTVDKGVLSGKITKLLGGISSGKLQGDVKRVMNIGQSLIPGVTPKMSSDVIGWFKKLFSPKVAEASELPIGASKLNKGNNKGNITEIPNVNINSKAVGDSLVKVGSAKLNIKGLMTGAIGKTLLGNIGSSLLRKGTEIGQGIGKTFTEVKKNYERIISGVGGAYNKFKGKFIETGNNIKNGADRTVNTVSRKYEEFKGNLGRAGNEIKNRASETVRTVGNGYENFKGRLSTVGDNIKAKATEVTGNVKKSYFDMKDKLYTTGENVKRDAGNVAEGVRERYNSFIKNVVDTYNRFKGTMDRLGSTIGGGLRSGLTSSYENVRRFVSNVGQLVGGFKEGLERGIGYFQENISRMVRGFKEGISDFSNDVMDTVERIGDKLDLNFSLPRISSHSRGTESHPGGLMVVGDKGEGNAGNFRRELVIFPNGQTYLSPNRDTLLNAPKGTKVLNAKTTKELLNIKYYSQGTSDLETSKINNLLRKGADVVKGYNGASSSKVINMQEVVDELRRLNNSNAEMNERLRNMENMVNGGFKVDLDSKKFISKNSEVIVNEVTKYQRRKNG